jgi:hypothetical protein
MIAAMAGYAIKGGKPGYDRLAVLARERWPIPEPCWSWPRYHRACGASTSDAAAER